MNPALQELARTVSNWGRWGADDERGTVNFVTPEVIKRASTCVRKGVVFSLGLDLGSNGPQFGQAGRVNPMHVMSALHMGYGNRPYTGHTGYVRVLYRF